MVVTKKDSPILSPYLFQASPDVIMMCVSLLPPYSWSLLATHYNGVVCVKVEIMEEGMELDAWQPMFFVIVIHV